MHKALIVLLLVVGSAGAGEIRGTVQFGAKPAGPVEVGYEALTATGEKVTGMAGLTIGDGARSAWCDTYQPRRTCVKWDPQSGAELRAPQAAGGRIGDIAICGQESNPTRRLVNSQRPREHRRQMNLAIRGIEADLGDELEQVEWSWAANADSFHRDLHKERGEH